MSLNWDLRDPGFLSAVTGLCDALGRSRSGGLVLKDIPPSAPGYVVEFRDGFRRERVAMVDVVLDVCYQ